MVRPTAEIRLRMLADGMTMQQLSPKRAPDPIFDAAALAPPNLAGYSYFDAAAVASFKPEVQGFDVTNATWLADAALLAYAPPDFAWGQFKKASLAPGQFFAGASTQVYAAVADSYVVIAFRGTEVRDVRDFLIDAIVADADVVPSAWPGGGNVHHGFRSALDEVWVLPGGAGLSDFLQRAKTGPQGPRTFWFTGHSLGAALATLAAGRYAAANVGDGPCGLFTFASPRVGDAAFAEAFAVRNVCRFVNKNDAIPRVPPPSMGFKHVGNPWWIDQNGSLVPDAGALTAPGDTLHGPNIDLIGAIKLNLFDHAPIYYATYIWNEFVATGGHSGQ